MVTVLCFCILLYALNEENFYLMLTYLDLCTRSAESLFSHLSHNTTRHVNEMKLF